MSLFIQKLNKINNNDFKIDPSIELLRIIGSLSVIGTHIKLEYKSFTNFSKIFFACLCADGVAIFWLILGFFFLIKFHIKKD